MFNMLEKDMENIIASHPEEFFPNSGFKLIGQQVRLGKCRADIIFEDVHNRKVIVEVKRGTLSRYASGQIMEYYGLLKSERVDDFVELILCANTIPPERKKFLELNGIECKEVGIDLINQVAEKFNYAFIQEIDKQINPVEQPIRQKENANQKEIIERKDKTVEEHLENASQEIKNLFYTINKKVLDLSFEIKRHTTGANILYKTSVNFVELGIQKQGLKLLLRTKNNEINDPHSLTTHVPKSHLWGKMTHTLLLKPNELNIKYTIVDVMDLINQSLKATY